MDYASRYPGKSHIPPAIHKPFLFTGRQPLAVDFMSDGIVALMNSRIYGISTVPVTGVTLFMV
jgi:hypothetical protein